MKIKVVVTLKPGVLDPQGKAIGQALGGLGFDGVGEVRVGKLIELDRALGQVRHPRAGGDPSPSLSRIMTVVLPAGRGDGSPLSRG